MKESVGARNARAKIPYTRLCYDLALTYTKIKFEQAVEDGMLPEDTDEVCNEEIDYLAKAFAESFSELTSYGEDEFFERFFSV